MEAFLVEHYRPGISVELVRRSAARVREAATVMERQGKAVSCLRFTIVPQDEAYLGFFEADSVELVREVYELAGEPFERISTTVALD